MKLKGAAKNMSPKFPVLLAAALGCVMVLLRLYQSLKVIDPSTGFFTAEAGLTRPLFYILGALIALGVPLVCWLCPLSKAEYIASVKNIPHALTSLLLAAAVGLDCYTIKNASGEATGSSVRHILAQSGDRLTTAAVIMGVLACIALVLGAVSFFTGTEIVKKVKVLQLAPALWALCKCMRYFSVNASYINNSAMLLCIFADVFLMIFFFEYARKVSGIAGDGNSPSFLGTALVAAILQLSAAVTGIIGSVWQGGAFLHAEFAAYRVGAVLFAVTAVVLFFKNKVPDYAPQETEIETHPLPQNAAEAPAPQETAAPAETQAAAEHNDEA